MPQNRAILGLIAFVTLAFAWVLWPLFGAIFWAVTFAIALDPIGRRLFLRFGKRRNLAALAMIFGFLLLIILPTMLVLAAVIQEATNLFNALQSGAIDLHQAFQSMLDALPAWSKTALLRLGLDDMAAFEAAVSTTLNDWIVASAPTMLTLGQATVSGVISLCVMLYLMFFLFRDGDTILARIKAAVPMEAAILENLLHTLTMAVRATVRGDILVALLQGCLGGLGLWALGIHAAILWTVLMAMLSLLPVLGAALVWGPIAIYLLANGLIWQSFTLIAYGVMVISLIDNIARPWLVGQATRMPDYVVLISTIGGIATFGMQGFITGPVVAAMFIALWKTFPALTKT